MMFAGNGGDMGDMVLNTDQRQVQRLGKPHGTKIGVQITGCVFRRHIQNGTEMCDRLALEPDRLCIVEPADMLRQKGFPPARHADRVLQVAAERNDRWPVRTEIDRLRDMATGAAQIGRHASNDLHDAVIGADHDIAVMRDDEICDLRKPAKRIHVGRDQRLTAGICAGCNEDRDLAALLQCDQQKMMHGRICQHDTQPVQPRRYAVRQVPPAYGQHDGMGRAFEQRRVRIRQIGKDLRRGNIAQHDGEWLFVPPLACLSLAIARWFSASQRR